MARHLRCHGEPNGTERSFSGTARYRYAAAVPIVKPEPFVYVGNADAGKALAHRLCFLIKARAIILDCQQQALLAILPCADGNGHDFSRVIQTMHNGVFRQRLQKKAWHHDAKHCLINLIYNVKAVGIAQLLDRKVMGQILQFVFQRLHIILVEQGAFEQRAQRGDAVLKRWNAVQLGDPFEGVERIEQKMRIDLVLERCQLQFPFALLR